MAHLRAEGKCFNCKETGHMSRNCPHKNTVAGSGNSKPPGLLSYSMDMTVVIDDDEEAILQAMLVGFIDVGSVSANACQGTTEPSKIWRSWYPFWQNPRSLTREKMDDCYEMTAEYILTVQQPYPGDKPKDWRYASHSLYNRFTVKWASKNSHKFRIHDTFNGFTITIHKDKLSNLKFNLGHWYAKHQSRALNHQVTKPTTKEYPPQLADPVILVTRNLLRNGINSHFPNIKPDTWTDLWFFVYLKDYGSTTYVIVDDDLDLTIEIDQKDLENPKFNLIKWYLEHAITHGEFHRKYEDIHKRKYLLEATSDAPHLNGMYRAGVPRTKDRAAMELEESIIMREIIGTLEYCAPYPKDDWADLPIDPSLWCGGSQFVLELIDTLDQKLVCVYDCLQGIESYLSWDIAC